MPRLQKTMPVIISGESSARIIDLGELRGEDDFPAYVAIHSEQAGSPYALSPTVMRWSENIHLSKLEDCRQFWLNQKKKLRCKLQQVFDPVLRHHYGDAYLAVFAGHPWQCLLYMQYQLQHQGSGFFFLQSRLDQNIYRRLDWDNWFSTQDQLVGHLLAFNAKGFREDSFRGRQSQFKRFIQRIGVATPFAMKQADANAIARRFGVWMGRIWSWNSTGSSELALFPWIELEQGKHPCVTRDLEYPVNSWAFIEVLLREDFSRLCDQFYRDDGEHVNRMQWQITLFNDQKINVELSFRHPYSLHRDMPEFNTAIYQARYIYDDLIGKLQARDSDLDLPETMPFIAWQVEVCERIQLPPMLWELFARQSDQIDYQQIMSLQNKLPVAFECYHSDPSFYPEQSFQSVSIGTEPSPPFDDYQWSGSSSGRPLFYYADVQAIDVPSGMQKFFLERNSNQWWLAEDALQSIRDYFVLKDHKGRASWVYRDGNGNWFKQGEYC